MKKNSYFLMGIFASLTFGSLCSASERRALIINNSTETVSVKGPTKTTNKVAVPYTLKPGEAVIKNLNGEGGTSETLVTTVLGNTTEAVQSYSKKYSVPLTVLVYVDENNVERRGPGLDLWATDNLSKPTVSSPTSF